MLDAVEDVLGPDFLCWNSSFFTKEAASPGYVSWHQDATYWGLSEPDVVTAWVAFTESTPRNGNMRVIPGSHRSQAAHVDTFHPDNLLSRGQEIAVEVDEGEAADIILEPGEMSLHHVLIVHGSRPNTSADRRIGYAIRYIPTRVRQVAGPRDSATLVRGRDAFGHFDLEPAPAADLDPEALALHADISDRQAQILYRGTTERLLRSARRPVGCRRTGSAAPTREKVINGEEARLTRLPEERRGAQRREARTGQSSGLPQAEW